MRILITAAPPISHFFQLAPLSWALRVRGHEVLAVAPENLVEPLKATGLPVTAASAPVSLREMIGFDRRGRPVPYPDGEGEEAVDAILERSGRGFGRLAAHSLPGTLHLVERWRPDLVLSEPTEAAGPLAATVHGVPWVRQDWGPVITSAFTRGLHRELAPERRAYGLTTPPEPSLVVDPCPVDLLTPWQRDDRVHTRYVPFNGPGAVPPPPAAPTGNPEPRLCLTFGSVQSSDGSGLLRTVLDGLADLRLRVLIVGPPPDLERIGTRARNVTAVGWAPLDLVLPSCAAVVHHGGIGTLLTSLSHGLPQVLFPAAAHDLRGGRRLEQLGAARCLDPFETDTRQIEDRTRDVLSDPCAVEAARGLAARMAAQEALPEVVTRLEAL